MSTEKTDAEAEARFVSPIAYIEFSAAEFASVHAKILEEFPQDWELQHEILLLLQNPDNVIPRIELAKRAREKFEEQVGKKNECTDEEFENIVLHAIASIQHRCVQLFHKKQNALGFILDAGKHIKWATDPNNMPKFVEKLGLSGTKDVPVS